MITRSHEINVGMLFDRDGAVWQIISCPKNGDLLVTGERIDSVKGIPSENALRNERCNKYWAVPTEVLDPKPLLLCFDWVFAPEKYNFRRPQI